MTVGECPSYQYISILYWLGKKARIKIYYWNNKKNSISRSVLHDCTVLFSLFFLIKVIWPGPVTPFYHHDLLPTLAPLNIPLSSNNSGSRPRCIPLVWLVQYYARVTMASQFISRNTPRRIQIQPYGGTARLQHGKRQVAGVLNTLTEQSILYRIESIGLKGFEICIKRTVPNHVT